MSMPKGWGIGECIWTLFEGDCGEETTTTTTSEPDTDDYNMGSENEVSTGFHVIEIHSRTVGFTLTSLVMLLAVAFLLLCCYRRFCSSVSLCPQQQPRPQAFEMQPLGPMQLPSHFQWSQVPPNMPALTYARAPPAYAAYAPPTDYEVPRRTRADSPPRIVTLDRSPRLPRRAASPARATAPPEGL